MQISHIAEAHAVKSAGVHTTKCPHDAGAGIFCSASIMTVVMSNYQKTNYCWTENYDNCPMYLAKILRGK